MKRRRQERGRRGGRAGQIFGILLVMAGFSVLAVPVISNLMAEHRGSRTIASYEAELEQLSEEQQEALLASAEAYNASQTEHFAASDPFAEVSAADEAEASAYAAQLDIDGTGMIGYIRIPDIDVEMPVWHGTSETVLRKGAGHVMRTSLPVGGTSTHAVLTAHRGLPGQALFTDLGKIGYGDVFYIKVCGRTLAYEVRETQTVLPEETQSLQIIEGKDQVTLVTCTPYGINSHRLLVHGERIPYSEAVAKTPDEVAKRLWFPPGILAAAAVLGVIVLVALIWTWRRKVRRRQHD